MANAYDETVATVTCCAPTSLVDNCSQEQINKTNLFSMIKVNCTFSNCDQSGFMHPECFTELESYLVKFLKSQPFSNNHKRETFRRYNFEMDHVRHFLWKEKGVYGMIYKHISCNCGKGYLKKDLAWPPSTYRRRKKNGTANNDASLSLPKLSQSVGGKVRYIPSYTSDIPVLEMDQGKSKSIPGAKFVDKKLQTKRGEVIAWDGIQEGNIKNLNNPEERICHFTIDTVQGCIENIEGGCEVEYQSVKKGKKMEAVSVRLVKSAVMQQGVITHWVPPQLAGIINNGHQEVVVHRKDFVAGGFRGDIVGKMVKFKIETEDNMTSAKHVAVLDQDEPSSDTLEAEDLESSSFTSLDLIACPLLTVATDRTNDMFQVVGEMNTGQIADHLRRVDPYLLRLAAHPVGYKLLIAMAALTQGQDKLRIIGSVADNFIVLSETSAGACCILEMMGTLNKETLRSFINNYLRFTSWQQLVDHMTGNNSELVFQSCVPLLTGEHLHNLFMCLCSAQLLGRGSAGDSQSLATLASHHSMLSLIRHASKQQPQSLLLLANNLERQNCLLDEDMSDLASLLLKYGVFLHSISGKMDSLVGSGYGRALLSLLIGSLTDLQLHIVFEEMMMENPDGGVPPLIVRLASGLDRHTSILDAILLRMESDTIRRVLEIFKDYLETILPTESGKHWIKNLSLKVNE